jgi:hypothetical protein
MILSLKAMVAVDAVLALTCLFAVVAWLRFPRLRLYGATALATGITIAAVNAVLQPPVDLPECRELIGTLLIGWVLLGLSHLASIMAIVLLLIEVMMERRRSEENHEVPSND